MDFVKDILDFHNRFGVPISHEPSVLDAALLRYRIKFLREELHEYETAAQVSLVMHKGGEQRAVTDHLEQALDGLVDLTYVAIGTASVYHGFDFNEAWRRVHAANMLKQRAPSAAHSKRNNAYDIIKPAGWQSPYLRDLVIT